MDLIKMSLLKFFCFLVLQHPVRWWFFQHISRLLKKKNCNWICIKHLVHHMWVKMCQEILCHLEKCVFSTYFTTSKESHFDQRLKNTLKVRRQNIEKYWCFPPESRRSSWHCSRWWHENFILLSATIPFLNGKIQDWKYLKVFIPQKCDMKFFVGDFTTQSFLQIDLES